MRLLKFLLLLIFAYAVHCEEGMTVKISEQGLNFFAKMGGDFLSSRLTNISVPDISGNSNLGAYSLKNISIAKISKPDISVKIDNGQGLVVSLPNISTEFSFNWNFQLVVGWVKMKDSGSCSASTSSLSIKLHLKFEKNATGSPKASIASCEAVADKVDFKVVGKMSALYKLYLGLYEKDLKKKMGGVVCEEASKLLSADPSFSLASQNRSLLLNEQLYLDYSLTDLPTFKEGYMLSSHVGEFVSLSGVRYSAATTPYTLDPDSTTPTKMLSMRVTERMVNSAAIAYHNLGIFSIAQNLTIPDIELLIGYTSEYPLIGNLVAKEAPKFVIKSDSLNVVCPTLITLEVSTDGITRKNVLSVEMNLEIEGNVRFEGNLVKGNITNIASNFKIINNNFAAIPDVEMLDILQSVVDASQESFNGKTNEGFSVPALKSVATKEATLKQGLHYFVLDADLVPSNGSAAAANPSQAGVTQIIQQVAQSIQNALAQSTPPAAPKQPLPNTNGPTIAKSIA